MDLARVKQELSIRKQESVQLVKKIGSGDLKLGSLELGLNISDTLQKATIKSAFRGQDMLIYTFVTILVKRFVDSFGFSTKVNNNQIEIIAIDTLEKFSYETVEDIIIFFKMARSGRFGTTKRGVDSNLIFGEWFPKYLELKAEERENLKTIEKNEHKKDINNAAKVAYTYSKITEKEKFKQKQKFKERVKEYVDRETQNMDRQMLEDWIVEWEKDPQRKEYIDILKRKRREIK